MATPSEINRSKRHAKTALTTKPEQVEKYRPQLATEDRALEWTGMAYQRLGESHYLLGNVDDAVGSFVLASQYFRHMYEVIAAGPTGEVEVVIPETGASVVIAGRPPARDPSRFAWIGNLALAITIRDLETVEVMLDFDHFVTGIGLNGPSEIIAASDKRVSKEVAFYRALLTSAPNAHQWLWTVGHAAAPNPENGFASDPQNEWYPHYLAAAALVTGDHDHFAGAVAESNRIHRSRSVPGVINWQTAALARVAMDNSFPAPEPDRATPDFFDPENPHPALGDREDLAVTVDFGKPLRARSTGDDDKEGWRKCRVVANEDLVGTDANIDYHPAMVAACWEMIDVLMAHACLVDGQRLDSILSKLIWKVLSQEITRPVGRSGFPSTKVAADRRERGNPELWNALEEFRTQVSDGGEISEQKHEILTMMAEPNRTRSQ